MADPLVDISDNISEAVCKDFAQSSRLEWLATNHTGAFAMGTVSGVNTRRYHGLLIATLNPPADRYSVLSRLEETVEYAGQTLALATVQYPGVVSPAGYQLLQKFKNSPCPTWLYQSSEFQLTKSVQLLEGQQSVAITYTATADCALRIRPFLSFRDYHSLMHQNDALNPALTEQPGHLSIQPYSGLPALSFYHSATSFQRDGVWFNNHEYLMELERGLDFHEDLYSPGIFHYNLMAGQPVHLIASLENTAPDISSSPKPFSSPISRALDQFRVLRSDGRPTLIAGYPWFTDWSRDTLISLPALMDFGFEASETKSILAFLLAEKKQGILPNRFTDRQSTPEYNTVDASLWFFIAAQAYIDKTNDIEFLKEVLFPAAMDIIGWHIRGTFYGIRVDPSDHLLAAGQTGVQLTWMDAKVGDYVVTPRAGKPVEINALWFNALQISSKWASLLSQAVAGQLASEADHVRTSFLNKFWNTERNCLYDVITEKGPDASLRPNQLFAISLPYPLLDRPGAQSIIQIISRTLLTPVGLRTLEPTDPHYCPRYDGDLYARDSAYHQGTVWPWLLGPFTEAYLYAFDNSLTAQAECRRMLSSISTLMTDCCIGSISEVYDGDAPHHPRGCPAQLWSVARLAMALHQLHQN